MTTDIALIELAVERGYMSPAQADFLKEELAMFPIGGSIVSHMVRKGLVTVEQANALTEPERAADSDSGPATGSPDDDFDFEAPASAAPSQPLTPPGAFPPQAAPPPRNPFGFQWPASGQVSPPPVPGAPAAGAPPAGADSSQVRRSIAEGLNASREAMASTPRNTAVPNRAPTGSSASMLRPAASAPGISRSSGAAGVPAPLLQELFQMGRDRGCSDLHLTVGKPPYLRQEGRLIFMPEQPLTASAAKELIYSVLSPAQQQQLQADRQLDFSFEAPGVGRFRANVYFQRLGVEGEFRFIPQQVPTLASLGMPPVLEKLTTYPQGLNLVTGPGGCGKTTTVAAMLEHINTHRHEHIITVEDPVEYVFAPKACQVTQREVGTHTNTFADALRTALRQDPDVIMIGELRDLETTSISITAAETGHLVFGTLHTAGAVRTVARILDVYPPAQRQQICMMVAESLRGIISQQLLPRKDGQGRACAMEILVVTTGVSQVIKEGKTHQLVSHMQSGRKLGMKSMDDALMELAQAGVIAGTTAYAYAENKPAFELIRTQS